MKKMMKTMLAVLLAAMLLLSCAVAETVETVTWTGKDGAMTLEVPADWIEINSESIVQAMQEAVESGVLAEEGVNEAAEQLLAQVESYYGWFYAPNFVDSLNVVASPSAGVNLLDTFDFMKEIMGAQFEQLGIEVHSIEKVVMGDYDVILSSVSYLGIEQIQAALQDPGCETFFTFTFTGSAMEQAEQVISSITFA